MTQEPEQPMSSAIVAGANETSIAAVATQARAQVEARLIVARKFPRDIDQVRERLMKDCKRPRFAERAEYLKPIGKGIKGPSIRFAEAAAIAFTNIDVQTPTIYDDATKRIVQVRATDLETNVNYSQDFTFEKTVERSKLRKEQKAVKTRRNSQGETVYIVEATDDEIFSKQNALVAKTLRNLLLRLIPSDLIDEGIETARDTLRNRDAEDPDAAKKRIADAFSEIGVPIVELKELLGHDLSSASPEEMKNLRSVYAEIRDGTVTWDEAITKVRDKRARQSMAKDSNKEPDKKPDQPTEPKKEEVTTKAEVIDGKTGEILEPELIELDFGEFNGRMLGDIDAGTLEILAKTAPHDHVKEGAKILLARLRENKQ